MLLTRCDCCVIGAIVIVATMFGQSSAQDFNDTTTIDLSDPAACYIHSIVVPRVPVLRFLLRENTSDHCVQNITVCPDVVKLQDCTFDGYVCHQVRTSEVEEYGLQSFTLACGESPESHIRISINQTYKVGCRNYMYPQNATMVGSTNPAPVNLSCVPVPVNASEFVGNVTTEWRKFYQLGNLDDFIRKCSNSPKNCRNSFRNTEVTCKASRECILTITNPQSNQAWFVPSFTLNDNSTYPAPYTFLYRWPRITSHYEFSLEVVENTSNYTGLKCEANSFPPVKTFEWTRGEVGEAVNIDSDDRYLFNNITANNLNGEVTITEVTITEVSSAVDNALFTCTVKDLEGRLTTDVSFSVRLRVKGRFRHLWPAVGIVGVGVFVALFIIIGHFCEKAIERYQNEPSNPSHHSRLQSITSTMDNETSPNNVPSGKKQSASQADQVKYTVSDHMPVKRLSSARIQLLEEPQS